MCAERAGDSSLADVLDVCRPTLAPALVDAPRLATLRRTCDLLPAQFAFFWGLESALGHDRAEVDLLVQVRRDSVRQALLAGAAASRLDRLCDRVPVWAELRRFTRQWLDNADPRRESVRNLWMELDLIAAARQQPPADAVDTPSVFWGPDDIGRGDWARFLAFVDYVRSGFAPFPASLPLAALERAITSLPGTAARAFQVGAMQLRGDVMLRLCINHLRPEDVAPWLAAQGWEGDAASLGRELAALAPLARTLALDVDYTHAGIGPRIGLECYQDWRVLDPGQWAPLLDHAAALGLATPSKRAAIGTFCARTDLPWQEQLDGVRDGLVFPVVYRNIHHIKLSFAGGAFTEAKAYLGITRPGVQIQFPFPNVPAGEPDEWLTS